MSTMFFPAGLTIDFRDLNMEEMEFYSKAWNLQRMQMQKGLFFGSIIVAHTPRMQLIQAPYSHGVLFKGDFPKGTILIAAVLTKADVTFQNKVTQKHEIKILKSGDEIDFLCNGENETLTIAVEEQLFYETYYSYFGQELHKMGKNKQVFIRPELLSYFIQGIRKWTSYLLQDHSKFQIDKQYKKIELEILEHVFSCIYLDDDKKLRQKFQIQKARDLLHDSIGEASSIVKLAEELGISERLLHHAFKKNYGITPKKYLLNLRMNGVKQDLLVADATTTITSIIQKHHFYNQSTFTQAYREMFGELPSHILKKSL